MAILVFLNIVFQIILTFSDQNVKRNPYGGSGFSVKDDDALCNDQLMLSASLYCTSQPHYVQQSTYKATQRTAGFANYWAVCTVCVVLRGSSQRNLVIILSRDVNQGLKKHPRCTLLTASAWRCLRSLSI